MEEVQKLGVLGASGDTKPARANSRSSLPESHPHPTPSCLAQFFSLDFSLSELKLKLLTC